MKKAIITLLLIIMSTSIGMIIGRGLTESDTSLVVFGVTIGMSMLLLILINITTTDKTNI